MIVHVNTNRVTAVFQRELRGIMQPCDRLTPKEIQVAMLVWEGQTNREIASVIGTAEQVIKNYLRNTFEAGVFGAASSWDST
jgi:DNA-binding NarL/FixJ family response regulator